MKKWKVCSPEKDKISALMLGCKVSSLTAASLCAKGYSDPESVDLNMNTDSLSDPFLIKDMQKAADILNEAIDEGKKICVYGDYDCDGVMATAILYTYLSETGADVMYYIPERSEGYGLNEDAIRKIAEEGVDIILTDDNGISAVKEADLVYELGMKLIITDHHQPSEVLPRAEAIVDPHRKDCFSPFKYACGAVVALKLIAAMDGGDYTFALEQFGDLAAIATVADIVSLTGENRYIVSYGLDRINNTDRPALLALKEVCGLNDKKLTSQSIGFGLAPRINASGRFGSPKTALKLFLTEDYDEALETARELDSLNDSRKTAENVIIEQIYEMIDSDPMLIRGRVIFLCGKGWHHGVIGIVASRIVEQFGKPCFIASEENGEIRGSARSFGEFSVFSALTYAADALVKFGGHPSAGGFTVKEGMAEEFRRLLEEYAFENHRQMPVLEVCADTTVSPSELSVENIRGLELLEPFGMDNEKPLFHISNAVILDIVPLSRGAHTKLKIRVGFNTSEAIFFRKSPSELGLENGDVCDMIVTLDTNEYKGNVSVSLIISDIRPASFDQGKYFAAQNAFEAFMRGESLPKNYYPIMMPSRDTVKKIYMCIPDNGISADRLFMKLNDQKLNYCRFCVSVEALRQLGLIVFSSSGNMLKKVNVSGKADLYSAPVLVNLSEKLKESI